MWALFTSGIGSFLKVVASGLDYAGTRLKLNNAPAIQANKTAELDQDAKDKIHEAVEKGDLDAIRKMVA